MTKYETMNICGFTVFPVKSREMIAATGGAFAVRIDLSNEDNLNTIAFIQGGRFDQDNLKPIVADKAGSTSAIFITPELLNVLTPAQVMFVLYHEEGHIVLRHVYQTEKTSEEELQMEFEADEYSMRKSGISAEVCIEALKNVFKFAYAASTKATQKEAASFLDTLMEDPNSDMSMRISKMRSVVI